MVKSALVAAMLVLSTAAFACDSDKCDHTLPNSQITPGSVDPTLTKEVICSPTFHTSDIRNVSAYKKSLVYATYVAVNHKGACAGTEGCEVDHLVPLYIGGSNEVTNLWPQPYVGAWGAHTKDKLEVKLHGLVCSGKLDLGVAQRAIATNWIDAYKLYVK